MPPPTGHQSRYQTHRIWESDRERLTHGSGSYMRRPIVSITYAALDRQNLKLTCRGCRYQRVLHCAALWLLFERRGWDDRLSALPPRFWCSRCRLQFMVKVKNPICAFVNEDETGDPLPKSDAREWKRMTARFRS